MRSREMSIALMLLGSSVASSGAAPLTDAVQDDRMTIVEVNKLVGKFRCAQHGWMSAARAVVVTPEAQQRDLALLHVGDLVRVETRDGRIEKIVVLRRGSDDTASPER